MSLRDNLARGVSSTKAPPERKSTVKSDASKAWIVVAGLVLVGFAACDTDSSVPEVVPKPEAKVVETTVAFPNVIGMSSEDADTVIEELFPGGSALTEYGGETYDYGVANRCLWTEPDGKLSDKATWPVSGVELVLNPDMPAGQSPTEPVQAGAMLKKHGRPFFRLYIEKPADVWCKPYGDVGPAGDAPNLDVPNNDDGGEPWICRHHRWC